MLFKFEHLHKNVVILHEKLYIVLMPIYAYEHHTKTDIENISILCIFVFIGV